jgi:NADH:ubiquinone oxidoreductase subunit K
MFAVAAIVGGLGIACMILRRSLLGVLIGAQLLILGSSSAFVLAGVASGAHAQGHLFGLFIALAGVGQLVAGYALSVRLFYLKKRASMSELVTLKH